MHTHVHTYAYAQTHYLFSLVPLDGIYVSAESLYIKFYYLPTGEEGSIYLVRKPLSSYSP